MEAECGDSSLENLALKGDGGCRGWDGDMEYRGGFLYTVVFTMFRCQGEVGRKKLEFLEKVRAIGGVAP